jgi:hypothetical protein
VRACRSLLFGLVLVLLLLATAAAEAGLACILAQVYNKTCPRLLLVPLEARKVGQVKLVIGLSPLSVGGLLLQARQRTYPLLELLVNRVQRVLDGYSFEVPCCYLEPEGEVEVNLLDWWRREHLLEELLVVYCCRRCVDFPDERSV